MEHFELDRLDFPPYSEGKSGCVSIIGNSISVVWVERLPDWSNKRQKLDNISRE